MELEAFSHHYIIRSGYVDFQISIWAMPSPMVRFRARKTSLRPHQFSYWPFQGSASLHFFVCTSVISYVAFVVSLFVPHLSFLWCLGSTVLRDYDISWISSLIFYDGLWTTSVLYVTRLLWVTYSRSSSPFSFSFCIPIPNVLLELLVNDELQFLIEFFHYIIVTTRHWCI